VQPQDQKQAEKLDEKAVIESLKSFRLKRLRLWGDSVLRHFNWLDNQPLDSCVPRRYSRWRLWDFSEGAACRSLRFLDPDSSSAAPSTLYLQGDIGTGKTSLAAATLHAWWFSGGGCCKECPSVYACLVEKPEGGLFLPAYEAAARLRDLEKCDEAMNLWSTTRLLILDDLGANRSTPHVTEQLLFLLQSRYDECRKTIVTTNLSLDALAVALGERAASRLQEGILIELTGGDRRGRTVT